MYYEHDFFPDPDFPVQYFFARLQAMPEADCLHWHREIELLYVTEGSAVVISDAEHVVLGPGELAVVNPDSLHTLYSPEGCGYHCIIAGGALLDFVGCAGIRLQTVVRDAETRRLLEHVIADMQEQDPFSRPDALAQLACLFVHLCRVHSAAQAPVLSADDAAVRLTKEVLTYLNQHFTEQIRIADLCARLGFSSSYVCHTFKQVTGVSVIQYVNRIRCVKAKALLATSQYNVTESAEQSGFRTIGYFSRTYKKLRGAAPSRDIRSGRQEKSGTVFPVCAESIG